MASTPKPVRRQQKRDAKESANWWLAKARENQVKPSPPRTSPAQANLMSDTVGPVPISYRPTRSSNPADPRTAAAGYDPVTKTLRVEWGDGGPAYNYYDVPPKVWQSFQRTTSPGKFINRVLNNYRYGRA